MLTLAAFAFGCGPVSADARGTASPFDAAARAAALSAIESTIAKTYVFPDLRAPIVAELERARLSRRYDVDDPVVFATRVTEDLRAASHNDGHLYLDSDRDEYVARLAPPQSSAGIEAFHRREAIRDHQGLAKMEVLPGNIRYVQLTGFEWVPGLTAAAYDDARNFLKDGDAIVIDLRQNSGGNSDAADYFSKAFIAPFSGSKATAKPIYLLVDGGVASAAEAVAYGVQQEKLGTIVGSTTYGAANNNAKFPIAPQFVLSVSYNRPIDPISGTNWEGVGVKPDIMVPGVEALDVAELYALDRLGTRPGIAPEELAQYRWARVAVQARLHPVELSRARLKSLAGNYGTIELRDGEAGLHLYRSDRPRWPLGAALVPLTEDGLFALAGYDDLRIRLTGKTLELLHGSEEAREVFPRSD